MRYFIALSYKGAGFCGWQKQENAPTIQEELEKVLSTLLHEAVSITGAGRTDTGVNAINYIAHFDSANDNLDKEPARILYKINAILPRSISVEKIYGVAPNAHARFDAISRTYRYYVHTTKNPFCCEFSYYYKFPVDINKMNAAAKHLIGKRDFSCFEKIGSDNNSSICDLTEAYWEATPYGYVFTISANRFLRNMVRAIVGTLLEVGRGRKEPEWVITLLESHNRGCAGQSVPGNALFLTEIKYPY